jgi:glycosyltransferase involved in cell wall biosynthesis
MPVTLVIIGVLRPVELDALARRDVQYENHVNLSRSGLLEQYQRADLLVFASTYEGFGLPIVEAQAVGRPVVAGNVCAMPEAAGGAACLVDPFAVADIRRGICRVLDHPAYAAELVERGLENASRYSIDRIALQYAAVYRAIAEAERSHSSADTRG